MINFYLHKEKTTLMKTRSTSLVLFQLVPIWFVCHVPICERCFGVEHLVLFFLSKCVSSISSQGKAIHCNNKTLMFSLSLIECCICIVFKAKLYFWCHATNEVIMEQKQQHVSEFIALVPIRLWNNVLHYHYHYHYSFTIHPLSRLNKHNMQIDLHWWYKHKNLSYRLCPVPFNDRMVFANRFLELAW